MRLFQWLTGLFTSSSTPPSSSTDEGPRINPATGLPMITPGIGGVDVGGNPFGVNLDRRDDHHTHHSHSHSHHDHHHRHDHHHHDFGSTGSSFDHWSGTGAGGFDHTRSD
ncbi:hypothetical protein [Erythrobacter donghaensis]|jgi:hypothetical protein|uniref:hypothetical protein n=2 Tax=Erythrobacter donghaensis TaxID=267135 RepID=UPI00093DF2A7|nr:hypothetical protein [Erythrobacter donghaensis]